MSAKLLVKREVESANYYLVVNILAANRANGKQDYWAGKGHPMNDHEIEDAAQNVIAWQHPDPTIHLFNHLSTA